MAHFLSFPFLPRLVMGLSCVGLGGLGELALSLLVLRSLLVSLLVPLNLLSDFSWAYQYVYSNVLSKGVEELRSNYSM